MLAKCLALCNLCAGAKDAVASIPGGKDLVQGFKVIHDSCATMTKRATPRQYISLLMTYKDVFSKKRDGIQQKQSHLQVSWQFYAHEPFTVLLFLML